MIRKFDGDFGQNTQFTAQFTVNRHDGAGNGNMKILIHALCGNRDQGIAWRHTFQFKGSSADIADPDIACAGFILFNGKRNLKFPDFTSRNGNTFRRQRNPHSGCRQCFPGRYSPEKNKQKKNQIFHAAPYR